MSNERIIELQPGETLTIKHANSPSEMDKSYSISEGALLFKINRSTIYRAEEKGTITLDRTKKSPKIKYSELLKLKK